MRPVRREALCIGVPSFGKGGQANPTSEIAPNVWRPLRFAEARTLELGEVLDRFGYHRVTHVDPITAQELGLAVRAAMERAGADGVLVIHVLSHGYLDRTGSLHVVGGDGRHNELTVVETWLRLIVNAEESAPLTLFLLDICHAGGAARESWHLRIDEGHRAWVIAACGPDEAAYSGRFTAAVTSVLTALAEGELDIDPSVRHAPIGTVAQRIRRRVRELSDSTGGSDQRVTATLVDMSAELPETPFFPNPQFVDNPRHAVRPHVDVATTPFLDDLDEALDPAHFVGRAAGRPLSDRGETIGFFSGRGEQLEVLAPWLNLQDDVGLRVVTGSPGAGKSALIGVLVCAAHPVLREPTRDIWTHVKQAPYRCDRLAAVHARQRTLAQVTASIARQLGITGSGEDSDGRGGGCDVSPRELLTAFATIPQPPVIVVDALDEAVDGIKIMEDLLLPAAAVDRVDGRPVRLLVGMRPWTQFARLRDSAEAGGGLTDLDTVPESLLRRDIDQYISRLLRADPRWNRRNCVGAVSTLAWSVAETLTADRCDNHWGAFLVAGLFTHHVLTAYAEPLQDNDEAGRLGATVPRTLPDLLDLDMSMRDDGQLRPVLHVLAHVRGDGMPAELIRTVAPAFGDTPDSTTTRAGNDRSPGITDRPTTRAVLAALDAVRFYLRHSAGPDGVTHYRLFHQGLADHLRSTRPDGARAVFTQLLASLGEHRPVDRTREASTHRTEPTFTARQWELAEPYLRGHVLAHAIDAGMLDCLFTDVGFLLQADPAALHPVLDQVTSEPAATAARLYATVAPGGRPATLEQREQVCRALALAAVRNEVPELARYCTVATSDGSRWSLTPSWSTGYCGPEDVTEQPVTELLDETPAQAVVLAVTEGDVYAVIGRTDGWIAVYSLRRGTATQFITPQRTGPITALDVLPDPTTPLIIHGGRTGSTVLTPITSDPEQQASQQLSQANIPVAAVAAVPLGRRQRVAVSTGSALRIWDLERRRADARFFSEDDRIETMHQTVIGGDTALISRDRSGQLARWSVLGHPIQRDLPYGIPLAVAHACTHAARDNVLVVADRDGNITGWPLDDGMPTRLVCHELPVTAVDCAAADDDRVHIASADSGGTIRFTCWDRVTGIVVETGVVCADAQVHALATAVVSDGPSGAGRDLIIVGVGTHTRLWRRKLRIPGGRRTTGDGAPVHSPVTAVALRPVQDEVLLGRLDGTVERRRTATGELLDNLGRLYDGPIGAIAESADDHRIAIAAGDGTVRIYSKDLAQADHELRFPESVSALIAGTLDGRSVLQVGGEPGTASLLDLQTSRAIGVVHWCAPTPMTIVVDGDVVEVRISTDDPTCTEVHRGDSCSTLHGHTMEITAVATGTFGRSPVVLTGDSAGVVRLWDLATTVCLGTVELGAAVKSVFAASDVAIVFVGGELLGLRYQPAPDDRVPELVGDPEPTEVFVIDGRPHYHLRGCLHRPEGDEEWLPVSEAIELGLTPCSLCEPPTRVRRQETSGPTTILRHPIRVTARDQERRSRSTDGASR